jgi:hypothetical protein
VAIVVVQSQFDQISILNNENRGIFSKLLWCFEDEASKLKFERAPEPTDVYWENLNVTSTKRFCRIAATYLATILVIGACFGIIYGINVLKITFTNKSSS